MSKCPQCSHDIADRVVLSWAARIMGRRTSKARAAASKKNGKLGGRPNRHGVIEHVSKSNAEGESRAASDRTLHPLVGASVSPKER